LENTRNQSREWKDGIREYWKDGRSEDGNNGIIEEWNFGIVEGWKCWIEGRLVTGRGMI